MDETIVLSQSPELRVIEASKAEKIQKTFEPMVDMLKEFESQFNEIITESKSEITEELIKRAKRLRLDIAKVRIETDKIRKEEKDEYLRAGKAIDGVSNIIKWAVVDKENALKGIEDYFQEQERLRLEELRNSRLTDLLPFDENAIERKLELMAEDEFQALLSMKKSQWQEAQEAARIAEENRIAEQKAREEEEARIKAENARLKAEAEERMAKEREIQAQLDTERKSREAAEARIAEEQKQIAILQREKELAEERERELEAQKNKKIADKEDRLTSFMSKFREFTMSELGIEEAADTMSLLELDGCIYKFIQKFKHES